MPCTWYTCSSGGLAFTVSDQKTELLRSSDDDDEETDDVVAEAPKRRIINSGQYSTVGVNHVHGTHCVVVKFMCLCCTYSFEVNLSHLLLSD